MPMINLCYPEQLWIVSQRQRRPDGPEEDVGCAEHAGQTLDVRTPSNIRPVDCAKPEEGPNDSSGVTKVNFAVYRSPLTEDIFLSHEYDKQVSVNSDSKMQAPNHHEPMGLLWRFRKQTGDAMALRENAEDRELNLLRIRQDPRPARSAGSEHSPSR